MKCAPHKIVDCRQCFEHAEIRKTPATADFEEQVTVRVTVQINREAWEKINLRANDVGRRSRTPREMVEEMIGSALQHNFVTTDHKIEAIDGSLVVDGIEVIHDRLG